MKIESHSPTSVLFWVIACVILTSAVSGSASPAQSNLTRGYEPIVVSGTQFAALWGEPVEDIFVYALRDTAWVQIPFQVDERDQYGSYFQPDDGIFDANDEVCFMSQDLGDQAPTWSWVANTDLARHEIQVVDGTDSTRMAWAYIYTSPSIWPGTTDYVDFDTVSQTVITDDYVMRFPDASHLHVMDGLWFTHEGGGDSVNILDRGKSRGEVEGQGFWITEEGITSSFQGGGYKDGRVRILMDFTGTAFGADQVLRLEAFYYKAYILTLSTISTRTSLGTLRNIRYSVDYNSGVSGLQHYDDYGAGGSNFAVIDGISDLVNDYPLGRWIEVDHPIHGCYLLIQDFSPFEGIADTIHLFYQDGGPDPTGYDTGDSLLWGESGIYIVNSRDTVATTPTITYLLPADQQNVGDLYEQYYLHPLQPRITSQSYTGVSEAGEDRVSRKSFALAVSPSPFGLSTQIRWSASAFGPGEISVQVYDLQGRLVRKLLAAKTGAVGGEVVWDGKNDRGSRVAGGVYIVHLENGREQKMAKVVLLR